MKTIYLLFSLILLSSISEGRITEGGWDSGGGSGFAAEFTSLGRDLAAKVESLKGFPATGTQFLDIVQKTKVEFTDTNLGKEGVKRFPEKQLLQISRKLWKGSENTLVSKQLIVLHQYLLLLGLDDSDSYLSYFVLDGGAAVSTYECSTRLLGGDTVSIRWIDVDNDGKGDQYTGTVIIKTAFIWSNVALINTFQTELGVAINWIEIGGGAYVLLPTKDLASQKSFKAKINTIDDYRDDGTPLIKATGMLSCKPIKR
ncbi:hypothetical protein B9G69_003200 [Bdellovibrio sp. SKB1291214]|uniref:hypothetical protein n=1 Tax=Bdellovibrio sp. SKB1291214 TaxID=1732569 RepID=UPI000B516058|nr:hypothetical protein [Bdellovibrio sp. SKB1291214]UYL09578.1 hypothetical protein B9G69_003200 [Bdellovibrio sp. SKB1291214]